MHNFWEVFAASAQRFAGNVAVEIQRSTGLEQVTYAGLRDMAEAIASELAARGIAAGDRCAILADNDARWCAVYLALLRLGAVAVPLDTNYSAAQVATVLTASGARLLVAGTRLLPTAEQAIGSSSLPLVRMYEASGDARASVDAMLRAPATPLPPSPARRDDPAVILYTSGTTSDPKGVVLTHGNLQGERESAFAVVDVSEQDAVLGVLPLFHSLAQMANLLLPFAVGARVVYLETLNTTDLLRALAERRITIFACVPQFFYLIHQKVIAEVDKGGWLKKSIFRGLLDLNLALRKAGVNLGTTLFAKVHAVLGGHMRLLVTGGSKFDPAVGKDLYGLGFTILQAYGLTETSGAATINQPHEAHIDTVGKILPGNELKVLPPEGDAEDGEIAIRGPIVMQGYYNRPDATAEVMRDGWFLTGDLGRIDGAGRLTITGRKKEIIVLASGKNIYPDEIEKAYAKSPLIKEICVMGVTRPDEPTTERLHAVVVPDPDVLKERKIVNPGDLLRFEMESLSAGLPAHKRVLGYDLWFEPLPRTTTGKLRRHEIQRRLRERESAKAAAVDRPATAAELEWGDDAHVGAALDLVAQRAKPGVAVRPDANLELDLGLDSMERVELLTELEQRFGVTVSETAAQGIATVRQLVEAVRPASGAAGPAQVDAAWDTILRDLPPATDPTLAPLLQPRRVAAPLEWLLCRVVRLLLARVDVEGVEHLPSRGPFLICPNHQGYFDPFLLCGVLPLATFRQMFVVGAAEYFETPLMLWVARQINLVPVNPDASLVPAMRAGAFGLSHGKVLLLFPEGERSIDGTVKRFKKGAPILAKQLGAPIVPVSLRGIFELWPRTRGITWRLLLPWSGHRVRIRFGPPLTVAPGESYAEATQRLRDTVDRLWQKG
ncbi:MAG: AMP-binding protein [Acidobacteria bacterium]|nr:AMP-binding protein [Acidobacteriota bacterium]